MRIREAELEHVDVVNRYVDPVRRRRGESRARRAGAGFATNPSWMELAL